MTKFLRKISISLCVSLCFGLFAAQNLWAFSLDGLSRSSAEVSDVVTITTGLATFNASSTIDIVFFDSPGGIEVGRVPHLGVLPNVSIDARVPSMPEGTYVIGVEINGTAGTNTLSPFHVVGPRPFQFNVLSARGPGSPIGSALPDGVFIADNITAYKDIDFGDIDNDGDLDIYSFNSHTLPGDVSRLFVDRLLINQGLAQGGTLGEYLLGPLPAPSDSEFGRTYDGDIVDLNGDGLRDIIRSDKDGIHLFINSGGGSFTNSPGLLPSIPAISSGVGVTDFDGVGNIYFDGVDSADVDGDGDKDLIFSNYTETGENLLLLNELNQATGAFVIANRNGDVYATLIGDQTHGAAFGDVDGDGDPDLFLTNVLAGQVNRLLINQGVFSGNFLDETAARLPGGSPNSGISVDALFSDLDDDGDQDIFFVDRTGAGVRNNLFWNDGTGNFTDLGSPNLPASLGSIYDLSINDVDFDGDLDIIESPGIGGVIDSLARILINKGGQDSNMLFVVKTMPFSDPRHRLGIDVGDIDLDLDFDLIAGGFKGQGVTLYENDLFNPAFEDSDVVIIIDRTGSMVNPAPKDFLTPVKNIAKAILMEKRPDDKVGIVVYEYTGPTPDPAAPTPANNIFKAETLLTLADSVGMTSTQVQTIVDGVVAGTCVHAAVTTGCTSIGQAIFKGLEEIKPDVDPERNKILVLLTDGHDNLSPSPAEILALLPGGFPSNVHIYAIALGTGTDNQMLSDISNLGSGFHQSLDAFNLADIFQNIESDATGKQIIPSKIQDRKTKSLSPEDFVKPTIITFDGTEHKGGTIIQDQFLKQGVRFLNDGNLTIPMIFGPDRRRGVPTISEPNTLTNTTAPAKIPGAVIPQSSAGTPLTIRFTQLQEKVGMFIGNGGRGGVNAILTAFDQEGNVIGRTSAIVPEETKQFIGIHSSTGDIAKVQLDYGKFPGFEQIDHLMFEPVQTSGIVRERAFFIDAQDKQIRVALSWQNSLISPALELIDPDGRSVSPAMGPQIQSESGDVFTIFKIKAPLVGTWKAHIKAPSGERTFLSIVASSGLKLSLTPDKRRHFVGKLMELTASLSETVGGEFKGLAGASVQVRVEKPNGEIVNSGADVTDKGNGTYAIAFMGADQIGTYNFRVMATVDPGTDRARSRVRSTSTVASVFNILDPTQICDSLSKLAVTPQVLVADGQSEARVHLSLRDCQGKPVRLEKRVVSFTTDAGKFVGQPVQVALGEFSQTLIAPTQTGKASIRAIVGIEKLDLQAMVQFVPGPVDPRLSIVNVRVSEGFIRADGVSIGIVSVTPLDKQKNRLGSRQEVFIDFKGPALGDWLGPVQDLGDGSYERVFRSRDQTGKTSFSARVNGVALFAMPEISFSVDGEDLRDSDNDGVNNAKDNCPFSFNPDQKDTDGDGVGDVCDPDDDNDGFTDRKEKAAGSDPLNPLSTPEKCDGLDNDLDGLIDEGFPDTDGDGLANCVDPDDDNDGFTDKVELVAGSDPRNPKSTPERCDGLDNDLDGLIDEGFVDTDGDGRADCVDPDDDNDGFKDKVELAAGSDPLNPLSTPERCDGLDNDLDGLIDEGFVDTDGDGLANCVDPDDDNDGFTDKEEIAAGSDPLSPNSQPEKCDGFDNDLDGLIDEGFPDTDGDGIADCVDPDADPDLDGVSNKIENGRGDGNNDGILDSLQSNVVSFPNDVDGRYITLSALPGMAFRDVVAVMGPLGPVRFGSHFPLGLFGFKLKSADGKPIPKSMVKMFLPLGTPFNTYYKLPGLSGANLRWSEFLFDGKTGAEISADKRMIVLHFVDGGRGDADGSVNGVIVDPGGPVFQEPVQIDLSIGLNMISIPIDGESLPDAFTLLTFLGDASQIDSLLQLDTSTGQYKVARFGAGGNPSGDNFTLEDGGGLIVHSKVEKAIELVGINTCPSFKLKAGTNLIGVLCPATGETAFQLLISIGDETVVSSIERFNPETGGFETAAYRNGFPAGVDFPIVAGEGYLIEMR